ncbi:MAG: acyl-CoA desaturase [Bacteroidetes bacterium]|nr:acyl-CoA desaturase [Bacteroidota bacterium]
MQLPKFKGSKTSCSSSTGDNVLQSFHAELKQRISEYFESRELKSTGNWKLYSKAVILLCAYVLVYSHLVFFTPPTIFAILECLVLGGLTAAVGFNIMHDGIHGSFSSRAWVNKLAGLTLNMLGANNFMWKTKHNIIHHTYTNIDGVDDDIEARPLLRLCDSQTFYKIHKYQHWYFWAAYSLLYLWWIFFTDYKKYFTKRIGDVPLKPMKIQDHLSFWFFKATHFVFFIAIPISVLGFKAWLFGFLAFGLFTGFILSIVFQLAHTVEDTKFIHANQKSLPVEEEWAIHQLKTTANFATHNQFISWWLGGLNFQVEHHLFPRISHIHYPAISKIIRETCSQFQIPYIEYPRMRMALVSHVSHLRDLSRP